MRAKKKFRSHQAVNERGPRPFLPTRESIKRAFVFALLGLIFFAGFFGLDRSLNWVLRREFQHIVIGEQEGGKVNQGIQKKADVYVFGNSRARNQYNPEVMAPILGMSVFNAGISGLDILYYRCYADVLEQHHIAKMYIVQINLEDLHNGGWQYARRKVMSSFLRESVVVREVMYFDLGSWMQSNVKKYKYIWTYHFNARMPLFARQAWGEKPLSDNGFIPLTDPFFDDEAGMRTAYKHEYDEFAVEQLLKFIDQARSKDIQVILSMSPEYRYYQDFQVRKDEWYFILGIMQIAREKQVPLIPLMEGAHPYFRDPAYYANCNHLNLQGANFFSDQVARHVNLIRAIKTKAEFKKSIYYPVMKPGDSYPINPAHFVR